MNLSIDFETYSEADLPKCGLDNYAKHPSTGVHCMAFAFGDAPVYLWDSAESGSVSDGFYFEEAMEHVRAGGLVYAHNAAFELATWNNVCVPKYGWPPLRPSQVRCTMAMAYAMSLPGALDKVAAVLGIEQRKDTAGARVMLQLSKPREDGTFYTPTSHPEKFDILYTYCKQDVEVERAIHARMVELSAHEQAVWELDYKINQRGVQVDLAKIEEAMTLVEAEKKRLDSAMLKVTGGVVGKCTEVALLIQWIRQQGVAMEGVAKSDVLDALSGDLPDNVRQALHLRKEAAKSSTAKLVAMQKLASSDGRVRNTKQYHGATTGRWGGRGIQTDNYPRPRNGIKPKHIEDIIAHFKDRDYIDIQYGPVMDAIADSLRGMITAAQGHELVAMDFSAIEARVLAWLAGEEKVLDIFRSHGKIYEHAAAGIYQKDMDDVTKDERQIGKVAVLALGYGGGIGAFQSMAKVYGVKVEDETADGIKLAWRAAHPNIVQYWKDLEQAAIDAIDWPGMNHKAGPKGREVIFRKEGSFLWCKLPSGRVLCYPYATIQPKPVPWGGTKPVVHFWCVNGTTKKWEETTTYGGSLAENVTQAVARDLLAEALLRMDARGFAIVMHVHDEIVVEIASNSDNDKLHQIEKIMAEVPAWAVGLPVAAEGWRAPRYRK